jgi:hypothetical protein
LRYEPTATDRAFAAAVTLRKRLGSVEVMPGIRVPTGIPHAPVHEHVLLGLRDHDWPLTKYTLRIAQLKDKAASERLWTEENA